MDYYLKLMPLGERFIEAANKTIETPEMFHYTSMSGLDGILFQQEYPIFWFSRFDCLNDTSEGREIIINYQTVLNHLIETVDSSEEKEFYEKLVDVLPAAKERFEEKLPPMIVEGGEEIFEMSSTTFEEAMSYICSFSKNKDNLAMWNYYVKGRAYEGYNIGINPIALQGQLADKAAKEGFKFRLIEVIYDQAEKERLLITLLNQAYEKFADSPKDEEVIHAIKEFVSEQLCELKFHFKSSHFKHEEEIRAIVTLPKRHLLNSPGQFDFPLKYRTVNNYIVPYFEMPIEAPSIVSSVCLGPSGLDDKQMDLQREIMRERLRGIYSNAIVQQSNAPIRY